MMTRACLRNLGQGLLERYSKIGIITDLDEAISCFQIGLDQPNTYTVYRAAIILQYSLDRQQAYNAGTVAVDLLPRLTIRSLNNVDKQHLLGRVSGLASDPAATALQIGKSPQVALSLLEQGRGMFGTSLEEVRVDIQSLMICSPDLAEKFESLRRELDMPLAARHHALGVSTPSWQVGQNQRYDTGKEFDGLIDEIRKLPGFEDFLQIPNEAERLAAAKFGPTAIINTSRHRCDAILVDQSRVRALPLPDLNLKQIEERAIAGDLGSPQTLGWLWDCIARPVLDDLGFTQSSSDNQWPHLWWIPTGRLSKFPLHAAGHHGSYNTVLDRVMSSYSSSIKAIVHGRRRGIQLSTPAQALLVVMESTPKSTRLPFALEEAAVLRRFCKATALNSIEPGRRKQDVMLKLSDCQIFHFAGHGYTDALDPLNSHLQLEDWEENPLRVADLLEFNLRKQPPFLAYLSACGTGRIEDEKYTDESIHLISACQLAGFRHVIGTLWEVNDELSVDMARIVYEVLRARGMADNSICWGLHMASRELRDRWLSNFTHMGHERAALSPVDVEAASRNEAKEAQQLPRDATLQICGDKYKSLAPPPHWVPYVHFGV